MEQALHLRLQVLWHLFLVYISWGTTYVGFRLTLEVVGPFFACGFRMGLGGLLLCLTLLLFKKWRSVKTADLVHSSLYAVLLVVVASGFLSYGQQYVPSGIAAVITGSTPVSMLVFGWLFAGERRPTRMQCLGFLGGSTGLFLLTQEQYSQSPLGVHCFTGILFVLMATFGWVTGSLLIKRHPRTDPLPPLQDCGLLLLCGGLECIVLGLLSGEQYATHFENLDITVTVAFLWMVIGGAILAYSSYFWLLDHVPIAIAVSYEYVVPIIALYFGWLVCDEEISRRMILACCMIIVSVFLIIRRKHT